MTPLGINWKHGSLGRQRAVSVFTNYLRRPADLPQLLAGLSKPGLEFHDHLTAICSLSHSLSAPKPGSGNPNLLLGEELRC